MLPIETMQLRSLYFLLVFVREAAAQCEIVLHVMHSFISFNMKTSQQVLRKCDN